MKQKQKSCCYSLIRDNSEKIKNNQNLVSYTLSKVDLKPILLVV